MLADIILDIVSALTEAVLVIREPRAALMDNIIFDGEVEYFANLGYALAVHDIELSLFEGRSDLILDYLSPCARADELVAGAFELLYLADIDTDRSIELQRTTAGCDLGVAIDNADLFTQLVYENYNSIRL